MECEEPPTMECEEPRILSVRAALAARPGGFEPPTVGLEVLSTRTGAVVFRRRAEIPLICARCSEYVGTVGHEIRCCTTCTKEHQWVRHS